METSFESPNSFTKTIGQTGKIKLTPSEKAQKVFEITKEILEEFKLSKTIALAELKKNHSSSLTKLGYQKGSSENEITLIINNLITRSLIEKLDEPGLPIFRITREGESANLTNNSKKIAALKGKELETAILKMLSSGKQLLAKDIVNALYKDDFEINNASFSRNVRDTIKRLEANQLVTTLEIQIGKGRNTAVKLASPEQNIENTNINSTGKMLSRFKRKGSQLSKLNEESEQEDSATAYKKTSKIFRASSGKDYRVTSEYQDKTAYEEGSYPLKLTIFSKLNTESEKAAQEQKKHCEIISTEGTKIRIKFNFNHSADQPKEAFSNNSIT